MAEERPLLEEVLDYVIYAPIGVAVQISKALPDLISSGRAKLGSSFGAARMIGEFTVGTVRRKVDAFVAPKAADSEDSAAGLVVEATAKPIVSSPSLEVPDSSRLAIPGYDTLAASQVVARLGALSADELEEIRTYESAVRGRRTILARIEQLRREHDATG